MNKEEKVKLWGSTIEIDFIGFVVYLTMALLIGFILGIL